MVFKWYKSMILLVYVVKVVNSHNLVGINNYEN